MAHLHDDHDPLDSRTRYSLLTSSVKSWNWRSVAIEGTFGHVCAAIGLLLAYNDEVYWLAGWFAAMLAAWLVHNIILVIQLVEVRKKRHDHVKKLYWINLVAVVLIDLGGLLSFVFLKTTQPAYPNSAHTWIWAMAGLQLFPFIACLESTWRYRRYMQFVTTHQHIDDIALDSIPQRRSSRRDPTARHSTTNRASPTYAQPPGDSTATDSDTHQRRVSPHQVTHSHYGALPRSTTFSRPTSSATLDPYDTHPEHRGASLPFSLSHGRREAREEGSEDESSDSLAPVLLRRSSRQSSKRRG